MLPSCSSRQYNTPQFLYGADSSHVCSNTTPVRTDAASGRAAGEGGGAWTERGTQQIWVDVAVLGDYVGAAGASGEPGLWAYVGNCSAKTAFSMQLATIEN